MQTLFYLKQCDPARLADELKAYEPLSVALTTITEYSNGLPLAPFSVSSGVNGTTIKVPDSVDPHDVEFVVSVHKLTPSPPPPPPPPVSPGELDPLIASKLNADQTLNNADLTKSIKVALINQGLL